MNPFFCNVLPVKKIEPSVGISFSIFLLSGFALFCIQPTSAIAYDSNYTSSSVSNPQPIARWYRYYNSNGQPSLSSTITEQHMRHGYEALDRNMQVIKRVQPYTTESYAKQKARRDVAEAKRQSDMTLRRAYGSAAQASVKRDQMLADMSSRKSYLQTQLFGLQRSLRSDIAQAANLERQNKALPFMLKKSIADNKKNVFEAQQNIQAITEREKQVTLQYTEIIRRLNGI